MPYQPLGDLLLQFRHSGQIEDYYRELSLETATATVRYRVGATTFTRKVFASYPDQVIVIHLVAQGSDPLDFTLVMKTPHVVDRYVVEGRESILDAHVAPVPSENSPAAEADSIRFQARLRVLTDGTCAAEGDGLRVTAAHEALLLFTAATNYVNWRDISADPGQKCHDILQAAEKKDFSQLCVHIKTRVRIAQIESLARPIISLTISTTALLPLRAIAEALRESHHPAPPSPVAAPGSTG
jgi:alpha-L-fucosidase 2